VQNLVVEALNKNLKSKVYVGAIEPSALSDIPDFSLNFKDVVIYESPDYTDVPDTLIYVEHLSLQFDLLDIYQGKYEVKEVEINDGFGRFVTNKKNIANYFFWAEDTSNSVDTSQFEFALSSVSLTNVKYSFIDKSIRLGVGTYADHISLQGNFTRDNLELLVQGEFDKTNIEVAGVQYLKQRNLKLNSGLQIDHHTSAIQFLKGDLIVDNSFSLTPFGEVNSNGYWFKASGGGVKLNDLITLVPKAYSKYVDEYLVNGKTDLEVAIKGSNSSTLPPLIEATFKIIQGSITHNKSQTQISKIDLAGNFTNGKYRNARTSKLVLNQFAADVVGGHVTGQGTLTDFNKLITQSKVKGQFYLAPIKEFFAINGFNEFKGGFEFDLQSRLILSKLVQGTPNIEGSEITGTAQFDSISILAQRIPLEFSEFSGKLGFPSGELQFSDVSGKLQSSSIKVDGKAQNFLKWLFASEKAKNYPLRIEANAWADDINMEDFLLDFPETDSSSADSAPGLWFTEFKLHTKIDHFTFRKFEAYNFESSLFLQENKLLFSPVKLDALGGKVETNLKVETISNNQYRVKLLGELINVDVDTAFGAFSDFGQQEITSDNLRGVANTSFEIDALANENLELLAPTANAFATISIKDGKLLNYTTLKAVSDYFKKNVVLRAAFKADELEKSLMDISFNKLENEIYIKNSQLLIPKMKIGNNIMTILAEGKHGFDGRIDYRLEFDISELLIKNSKADKNNETYTQGETGGIRIFLRVTGTHEEPLIEIDKERRKAYRKAKRNNELHELKSAFHTEFGVFSKDTSLKTKEVKEKEFEIEWEEDPEISDPPPQKSDSSVKKKKKRNIFKSGQKVEEEDFEFDFDDDL
jgi:hypothetical protein